MRTHLRDVKLDRLVNFVVMLTAHGETRYEALRNNAESLGILSPGVHRERLAKGTFYRYLLACQEFGFVEKTDTGLYRVTNTGIKLTHEVQRAGLESSEVRNIVRRGFLNSRMVNDTFVSLFTCEKNTPLWEGKPIAYVPLQEKSGASQYKVYQWCSNTTVLFDKSETRAMLWGLRLLAMDLGLVDELAVPRSAIVPPDRTVIIFPTLADAHKLAPREMHQTVLAVLTEIADETLPNRDVGRVCLVAIPDVLYLLCPLLRHSTSLVRDELAGWVEANEEWVRAEKVAGFVRDYSFVERGLHRRFGRASEKTFIKLRDYHISHLAFRYQSLLSATKISKEVSDARYTL